MIPHRFDRTTYQGFQNEIARAHAAASPRAAIARLWHRFMFKVYDYIMRYGNYVEDPRAYARSLEVQLNSLQFDTIDQFYSARHRPDVAGDGAKVGDSTLPQPNDVAFAEGGVLFQNSDHRRD